MNLIVKEASIFDTLYLLKLKNDPISIQNSIKQKKVFMAQHLIWMANQKIRNKSIFFIGYVNNTRIGLCRFQKFFKLNYYEVSIVVDPHFRGLGYAQSFLSKAIHQFSTNSNLTLRATIKSENNASRKVFERTGFRLIEETNKILKYQLH